MVKGGIVMETAKIFENGRSQAVRLPKEFRFTGDEVFVQKIGSVVMLIPKDKAWETFVEGVNSFSEDCFSEERDQGILQKRESF